MILNTKDYLDLMEKRAKGLLPEMGSAQRIAQLIQSFVNHNMSTILVVKRLLILAQQQVITYGALKIKASIFMNIWV